MTERRDTIIADEMMVRNHNYDTCVNDEKKKFMVTFPYPYQNGTLHLGHAYTLLRCDIAARFHELLGYNVLFPFGYHGTGVPIYAAASKIRMDENGHQGQILESMGIKKEEISNFKDPYYWLRYFPALTKKDITDFGCMVDHRRSFITTDLNPHYDAFVKWQFEILNQKGFILRGKSLQVYSVKDDQVCNGHDRKSDDFLNIIEHFIYRITTNEHTELLLVLDKKIRVENITKISIGKDAKFTSFLHNNKQYLIETKYYHHFRLQIDINVVMISDCADIEVIFNLKIERIEGAQIFLTSDEGVHTDIPNWILYVTDKDVISRTDDLCVVANVEQYFINYGDANIKEQVSEYIRNTLEVSNDNVRNELLLATERLDQWPCSRSKGLGTKLLDTEYVIDSLSDSTIYMAYYTVAHIVRDIPIPVIREHWYKIYEYIFRNADLPDLGYDELLKAAKREFTYWYPVDIRVSGKDLITTHLTMCLFAHVQIWGDNKYLPRKFYVNGHCLLNGKKMSKSTGNFMTLREAIMEYGTDPTRLALVMSGTGLLDANFTSEYTGTAVYFIYLEKEFIKNTLSNIVKFESAPSFESGLFETQIHNCINEAYTDYLNGDFQNIYSNCITKLCESRREYMNNCGNKPDKGILIYYIRTQALLVYPICPHFSEYIWRLLNDYGIYYERMLERINLVETKYIYYSDVVANYYRLVNKAKKRKNIRLISVQMITRYNPYQVMILGAFESCINITESTDEIYSKIFNNEDSEHYIKSCKFIVHVKKQIQKYGHKWVSYSQNNDEMYDLIRSKLSIKYGELVSLTLTEIRENYDPENPIVRSLF